MHGLRSLLMLISNALILLQFTRGVSTSDPNTPLCNYLSSDCFFDWTPKGNVLQPALFLRRRRQSSNLPTMYDPTVNVDSPDFAQVLQKNEQALEKYEDPDCTGKDPYWCEGYVNTYMDWQTQINHFQHEDSCAQLKEALVNADNRCCQAVRANGC